MLLTIFQISRSTIRDIEAVSLTVGPWGRHVVEKIPTLNELTIIIIKKKGKRINLLNPKIESTQFFIRTQFIRSIVLGPPKIRNYKKLAFYS